MKNSEEIARTVFDIRDRYLENKKQKNRKAFLRFASFTAAAVCGCMTLCFGGYAVWNYVVKPIVIEEKEPETPVITQTAVVTQTENPTETTVTTVTTVTTAQTAAETTAKITAAEPVTEVYEEEEEYTEPVKTTAKPEDVHQSKGYKNYQYIRQTLSKMLEYIEQNDVDVIEYFLSISSGAEKDHIEVKYANDRGREDIEWFLKENNIDMSIIEISEMSWIENIWQFTGYTNLNAFMIWGFV